MTKWPMMPLGSILSKSEEWITPEPDKEYSEVTVRLWGKGVVLRGKVTGSEIAGSRRLQVRTNQFILSRIDARNGAAGLVPDALDGALVTNDFPVYGLNGERVAPWFLNWMSKTPTFVELCKRASEGTTNRVRLKEDRFLSTEIPLPPLPEQLRIVARIESLTKRIEEARGLRHHSELEADLLVNRKLATLFEQGANDGWLIGQLGDYVIDDCYGTSERTTGDVSGIPVLRMGNIQGGHLDLRHLKYLHLSEKDKEKIILKSGDVLVNRTNSAELVGKCAVFDEPGEYSFASYLIRLRLDIKRANPRLVAAYINSPAGRSYMFAKRTQMTGQANVNATKLKALPIALPTLEGQHRIVAYLDGLQAKVDALKKLQAETAAELAALLPSILDKAFKGEL